MCDAPAHSKYASAGLRTDVFERQQWQRGAARADLRGPAREANLARVAPQHLQAAPLAVRSGPRLQDTRVRQGSDCVLGPARTAHASSCAHSRVCLRARATTRARACRGTHCLRTPALLTALAAHTRVCRGKEATVSLDPLARHKHLPVHTLVCLVHTRVCCLGTTGVPTATKLSPGFFGPRPAAL